MRPAVRYPVLSSENGPMPSDDDVAPRFASDKLRGRTSAVVAMVVLGGGFVLLALAGDRLGLDPGSGDGRANQEFFGSYFVAWIVYCVVQSLLTVRAFSGVDGRTLAAWLRADDPPPAFRWFRVMTADSGTAGAVMFCIVAVVAVVIAATQPSLRGQPGFVVLAFLSVAGSWLLIIVTFAALYARKDAHENGLAFPGSEHDDLPEFFDYLYFSVQIGTAFTSSDVSITDRSMRRTVTAHSLVAFVFNTVIVALLVSFLLAVVT